MYKEVICATWSEDGAWRHDTGMVFIVEDESVNTYDDMVHHLRQVTEAYVEELPENEVPDHALNWGDVIDLLPDNYLLKNEITIWPIATDVHVVDHETCMYSKP